jgi:hypothetical protein
LEIFFVLTSKSTNTIVLDFRIVHPLQKTTTSMLLSVLNQSL